jgi:tRNA(fMet)-specific endonuclease VapC
MPATWLLDTNVIIHSVSGRPPRVRAELRRRSPADVALSSVTVAELWYGAAKHPDPARKRIAWMRVLAPFDILPFDRAAAEQHADIRYAQRHNPIGERDLLVAAIAVVRGLTVVTHNTREFKRVPGLVVEDWSE